METREQIKKNEMNKNDNNNNKRWNESDGERNK